MSDAYSVKDGDKADFVVSAGAVRMSDKISFCELCDCYRASRTLHVMRVHGTPYYACDRHTPIDRALWEHHHGT